jgi:hypothetical protein
MAKKKTLPKMKEPNISWPIGVLVPVTFTREDIWNQIVGALEGGSNYWIDAWVMDAPHLKPGKKQVLTGGFSYPAREDLDVLAENNEYGYQHQAPLLGGRLIITVEGEDHILSEATIEKGIKIMAKDCPNHFNDIITEGYDAITSDVFLQCCLFGEIIYG